jgi:hypothetical protein
VADRSGLSCYSCDKICTLLKISVDDYTAACGALIALPEIDLLWHVDEGWKDIAFLMPGERLVN